MRRFLTGPAVLTAALALAVGAQAATYKEMAITAGATAEAKLSY